MTVRVGHRGTRLRHHGEIPSRTVSGVLQTKGERNTEFHYAFKKAKDAQGNLTASCKRFISWFFTKKPNWVVKLSPLDLPSSKGKEKVCCIFEGNRKIRVKRFRNNFSGGRYQLEG
ncbi:hypothetical protein TNCV_1405551 [Trichonephila clavipes]|nr:hypothetical protein TNCV_1405551 [Trichonephila clavipes]